MKKHLFAGSVSRVTANGQFAVVRLDHDVDGVRLAVISTDTVGRRKLGILAPGVLVKGTAKHGADALDALTVKKQNK